MATNKEIIKENMGDIIEKFKANWTIKSIAKHYSVDRKVVSRELKKNGVVVKNNQSIYDEITSRDIEQIIKLHNEGSLNKYQIAKKYKCSHQFIEKILVNNNVIKINEINDITVEMENRIYVEYFNNMKNAEDIAKYLNIPYSKIRKIFLKNKWDFRNSGRIHMFKEDIFSVIDTNEKAYWLGFLFGDGYNCEDDYNIEIALQESDRQHLEKFVSFIGNEGSIKPKRKEVMLGEKTHIAYRVTVCSKEMSLDLANLGCVQNKSLIVKFPKLEEDVISSFIAGYFDANGHVCLNKNETYITNIGITSGSEEFLRQIKHILIRNNIIECGTIKRRADDVNAYTLAFKGFKCKENFYNYAFKQKENYFLKRKQDIFSKVIKTHISNAV